ncbi:MAG: CDP-alcohol phosphatidyltransferase family protein [Anaerolineales bacterium]|nr:CDP-alcohol phosphatidyltransferase family protein [Anaerolineales bacterium]MCB8939986.1 CDP-alcohol phosphatidyltransferase family protein [Ardenticatenaceae bacterium]
MSKMNLNLQVERPLVLAWGVHLFTATGALWGLLAIMATVQHQWQAAFFWLGLAALVDSLDGTLARRFKVKGLLPGFDGALLDNIIDYQTYVIAPAIFLYEANLLPASVTIAGVAMVVLASAFQFCQSDAKTDDHTFKGFPSYWNVVVFYLFMFDANTWINFWVIATLTILVFVPIKYLYPSRMIRYQKMTLFFTSIWGILCLTVWWQYPAFQPWMLWASLLYLVYYVGLSLYMMFR